MLKSTRSRQTKTDVREFKTTVKNLHGGPMRITVLDRVPFSENAALTVDVLRDITPPTERQSENKRGVMAWSSEYGPGEQKEIRFGYRIQWPADKTEAYRHVTHAILAQLFADQQQATGSDLGGTSAQPAAGTAQPSTPAQPQ